MNDLLFESGQDNTAGLFLLRFAAVATLASMPGAAGGLVNGAVSFREGFRWLNAYGTDGTKLYSEEMQAVDDGALWTVSVQWFLPGDSAALRTTLNRMAFGHRFVIECQDNEGLWRRVGTMQEGLTFGYSFGSGNQPGDPRGYTLTFTGTLTAVPPILL